MAVNFPLIEPAQLYPVAGVTLGWAEANIRELNRKDVLVISVEEGAVVSGVFTSNCFCAAPVTICREHLAHAQASGKGIRALIVNTGNANAGTGALGLMQAREICVELARLVGGITPEQVLPFSTGVILEPLPVERLKVGLPQALANRTASNWYVAAQTIMTTDTLPKATSRQVTIGAHTVTCSGISKGAGMIEPNMATMLSFLAFDAIVTQQVLNALVKYVADRSFNCITIDGDMSTNDSFILIASGKSNLPIIMSTNSPAYVVLRDTVTEVAQTLAQLIVRDGEGATKLITIQAEQGTNVAECRRIAYAISHSLLVKTAFYASDPNFGRILAAIGYAGIIDLNVEKIDLYLDNVLVAKAGGLNPDYREEDGQRVMRKKEITVRVLLGRGNAQAAIWTCDLSHDYVRINADYRS